MKRYQIVSGGQTFDVRVVSDPSKREVSVEVDGELLNVLVDVLPDGSAEGNLPAAAQPGDPAREPSASIQNGASAGVAAGNTVIAPLPGVVKSIRAHSGQRVALGDELLVIEAMKMDNTIRATREGVIRAVHVSEGHRVTHGQRLIEFSE